ncbi:glycosyltransferase family 2 protein [Qiania dongpingensis]|uniref:Glycosyltransferase n=1 Tax=Qiania dongpingensis TaxID=2763669 RepID=A0A7G9G7T0_9FIRM|nr:glycosyltransferase family A protein [Qiania dongpingensis]QNM06862.1 glycosyltransferase [Qiania dongpingensis]
MPEQPLISVLLTNYNREQYLPYCIESVLNQTYRNLEFVIIDDGSSDNSVSVIDKYHDSRIHFYKLKENHHISYATNYGLQKLAGDYLAYMDSDDIWSVDKLEKQLTFLQKNPHYKACFTWVDLIDEQGQCINSSEKALHDLYASTTSSREEWLRYFFFEGNRLSKPSALVEINAAKETGCHTLAYVQAHDFDWWIRLTMNHSFAVIEEPLIQMRRFKNPDRNASGESPAQDTRFFNEYMMIRAHFFDNMPQELFTRAFQCCFINKSASSKEELECEKAFLLQKCVHGTEAYPIWGLYKLAELLQVPATFQALKTGYNFTPKDYYELNKTVLFYSKDRISELENIINSQRDELLIQQVHIEKQDKIISSQIDSFKQKESRAREEIAALFAHVNILQDTLNQTVTESEHLKAQLSKLYSSASWKITKPIRFLNKFFRNSFGKRSS